MIKPETLNILDKDGYIELLRDSELAIKAIAIIENIARAIEDAHGNSNLDAVSELTVKELALIAARNSINIRASYVSA